MAYRVFDQRQVSAYATRLVCTTMQSVLTNHDLHSHSAAAGLALQYCQNSCDQNTMLTSKTQKNTILYSKTKEHAMLSSITKNPVSTNITIGMYIYRGGQPLTHLCAQDDMMPCVSLVHSADVT